MLLRIFVSFFLILFEVNEGLVVNSPSGLLSGWTGTSRQGRPYWAFTKVPFALPPVGKLRLKNPVPYGRWEGLYEATKDVPLCIQDNDGDQVDPRSVSGTEDCLYLNVYVPDINQTNLPVIVSVYGGKYMVGKIGPRYVADYFMDEDVVLVAMNYRVGALGFMSMEDQLFPGNYGLKDQALALKWTKDNIASFGGNPDLMTVVGVSAGAASTHHLMLSPLTKDLIKGAVSISGTVNKVWSVKPPGLMRNRTLSAATVLACDTRDSHRLLACLQGLDAWKIYTTRHLFPHDIAFAPTVEPEGEGAFIPVDPSTYRSETPWMVTFTNGNDYSNMRAQLEARGQNYVNKLMNDTLNEFIGITAEVKFDESKPNDCRVLNKIKARYFHPNSTDDANELGRLFEDVTFVYTAFDALERHAGPAYFAKFECDVLQDGFNIAAHGSESQLLYKKTEIPNEIVTRVSKRYLRHIADFAKYQNPTSDLSWTSWKSNEIYRITCDRSFMGQPEVYAEKENVHGFWKGLFCDPTLNID